MLPCVKTTKDFKFYMKPKAVIVVYQQRQYIAFHNHGDRHKKSLESFKQEIMHSRGMSLDKIYGLARIYNIPAVSTSAGALKQPRQPTVGKSRIAW